MLFQTKKKEDGETSEKSGKQEVWRETQVTMPYSCFIVWTYDKLKEKAEKKKKPKQS